MNRLKLTLLRVNQLPLGTTLIPSNTTVKCYTVNTVRYSHTDSLCHPQARRTAVTKQSIYSLLWFVLHYFLN